MRRVMILAAGRGERMRPLTDYIPKPLLRVGGASLLEHHLKRLVAQGFDQIVINTAHLGEQIIAALGDGSVFGCSIRYSREESALETAGGIIQALPLLGEEPFLLVNGDIYTDLDARTLTLSPAESGRLVLVPNPTHHPQGDFAFCSGERDLIVRATAGAESYTYAGVALLRPAIFHGLAAGRRPLAPILFALAEQQRLAAMLHRGLWCDVGTPQRLAHLEQQLRGNS